MKPAGVMNEWMNGKTDTYTHGQTKEREREYDVVFCPFGIALAPSACSSLIITW